MTGHLNIWTIYVSPADYPGQYVARRFVVGGKDSHHGPTNEMFVADTLEEVRALLPPGLICMPREPGDDRVIVESWI